MGSTEHLEEEKPVRRMHEPSNTHGVSGLADYMFYISVEANMKTKSPAFMVPFLPVQSLWSFRNDSWLPSLTYETRIPSGKVQECVVFKIFQWKEQCLKKKKWWQDNWISPFKRMRVDPYLTPYRKINSTGIKVINLKAKAINCEKKTKLIFVTLNQAVVSYPRH